MNNFVIGRLLLFPLGKHLVLEWVSHKVAVGLTL